MIRWIIEDDLAAVVKIDAESYPEEPLGALEIEAFLDEAVNTVGYVLDNDGHGIIAYSLFSFQPSHLDVWRIGVRDDVRREGFGSELVRYLVESKLRRKRKSIYCDVSEYSSGAHAFLSSLGFLATCVLSGEVCDKPGSEEDAYRFHYRIEETLEKSQKT